QPVTHTAHEIWPEAVEHGQALETLAYHRKATYCFISIDSVGSTELNRFDIGTVSLQPLGRRLADIVDHPLDPNASHIGTVRPPSSVRVLCTLDLRQAALPVRRTRYGPVRIQADHPVQHQGGIFGRARQRSVGLPTIPEEPHAFIGYQA